MKYFDGFAGIRGFKYGIECASNKQLAKIEQDRQGGNRVIDEVEHNVLPSSRATPLCVGYSEIDRYAIQISEKNYPEDKNYGDITKIKWEDVPDFELFVGGFPCQAFSIAGKRGGFEDTRGTLFFENARCFREKRPRLFVLENVKGLLSHDKGATFLTILTTLSELGYDCQWQVLNSKNFGVPQNRERVFIVGHLRGTSRPEVFPIGNSSSKAITKIMNEGGNHSGGGVFDKGGVCPTLTSGGTGGATNNCPKIVASRGRNVNNPSDRTPGAEVEQRLEPNTQGTTNALTSVQKDNWLMAGEKIRRLTPTEAERLQGFPDGWTEGISDTQRYKCLGNAVTTNVITAIMGRLLCNSQ